MPQINLAIVDSIIKEVASTEIMPRFRKLAAHEVEIKSDNSAVTIADQEAERALIARLTDYLPGSVVIGEESFEIDPGILSHFGGEDYVWVIDPIDGTRHFIEGTPQFGSMIALVHRRQTVAAWIHDPNTGHTLMAEQGGGVWLGPHKMRLAGQDGSVLTVGIMGSKLRKMLSRPEILSLLGGMPPFQTGSAAAFDYGRLFTGDALFGGSTQTRAGFLLYRQSKPWDHVPGLFMLAEAGGYAADLVGQPYDMEISSKGLLLAPDRPSWNRLHAALKPAIDALLDAQEPLTESPANLAATR